MPSSPRARSSSSPDYQARSSETKKVRRSKEASTESMEARKSPRRSKEASTESKEAQASPRRLDYAPVSPRSPSFDSELQEPEDDPPLFTPHTKNKSRKKEYSMTEQEVETLQEARKTALKVIPQVPRTRSEEELMHHYSSYTRRSPLQAETRLVVKNWGLRPIGELLPSSVIVLVAMHGQTKEPITAPLNVARHIATDFGTCMFSYKREENDKRLVATALRQAENDKHWIGNGFLENKEKSVGEHVKQTLVDRMKKHRAAMQMRFKRIQRHAATLEGEEKEKYKASQFYEEQEDFVNSKHHEKVKKIKKGMPLFNKEYSMRGPSGHESHKTHSIYVRADLPLDRVVKEDCFFELRTEITTLKSILKFLSQRGVTDVTLFDWSCQGDDRSPVHRTRYGGTRKK